MLQGNSRLHSSSRSSLRSGVFLRSRSDTAIEEFMLKAGGDPNLVLSASPRV
jgi:hypothetical protein